MLISLIDWDQIKTQTSPLRDEKKPTNLNCVGLRLFDGQGKSSFVIGERLHEPLQTIYRNIKHDYPNVSPFVVSKVTIKAMNETIGENGLFPSWLVFGVIARLPIISVNILPKNKE